MGGKGIIIPSLPVYREMGFGSTKASEVIDQKAMYGLVDDLDQVFLKIAKKLFGN